jgi:hypothetical protein
LRPAPPPRGGRVASATRGRAHRNGQSNPARAAARQVTLKPAQINLDKFSPGSFRLQRRSRETSELPGPLPHVNQTMCCEPRRAFASNDRLDRPCRRGSWTLHCTSRRSASSRVEVAEEHASAPFPWARTRLRILAMPGTVASEEPRGRSSPRRAGVQAPPCRPPPASRDPARRQPPPPATDGARAQCARARAKDRLTVVFAARQASACSPPGPPARALRAVHRARCPIAPGLLVAAVVGRAPSSSPGRRRAPPAFDWARAARGEKGRPATRVLGYPAPRASQPA